MLFWESTARCNLSCAHCRRLDVEAAPDELTTDEAKAMLDSAAALGRPMVVFSGGEPLLRDDWAELARYAKNLGLSTALASNGTLIDDAIADRIAAAGFRRVAISLDGADAATHDAFRGCSGAFAAALAGADRCTAADTPIQFNATVTTRNADQLDALYALAAEHRAVAMHLFLLVPVGCGAKLAESQQLSAERYEQVLGWICDRQLDGGLELRATCAPHFARMAAQRGLPVDARRSRGCLCGQTVLFVNHRGEVFPCGYLPVSCGSIRRKPLQDIWRGSKTLAALRDPDRLEGKCGRCEFKIICGGCRARAYAATGNFLAEEPFCEYPPKRRKKPLFFRSFVDSPSLRDKISGLFRSFGLFEREKNDRHE
jgi:radical SAM protein with 4Fe4S-binding SPASM domain